MGICDIVLKICFVSFNLAFAVAGLALFIVGIIAIADEQALVNMLSLIPGIEEINGIVDLTALFTNFAVVFIVLGVIFSVIGILGTIGVCCDSKCMMLLYLTLIVLIILAEIIIIIIFVEYPETFSEGAQKMFRKQFDDIEDCNMTRSAGGETFQLLCSNDPISLGWNTMQFDMKCCGVAGFRDYNDSNIVTWYPSITRSAALAPTTCCQHSTTDKLGKDGEIIPTRCNIRGQVASDYYQMGCVDTLIDWMVTSPFFIGIMIGVGILELILLTQGLGQLLKCC